MIHPGVVLLIITGTATATWSQMEGRLQPFWGAFTDRTLVGRLLFCGFVAGLFLRICSVGIGWIEMLVAKPLLALDPPQLERAASTIGVLVAFLYPGVNWTLAPFLILDRRLTAWGAILISWNVIGRGWWGMLGLSLILLLPVVALRALIFLLPIGNAVQGILLLLLLGPSLALVGSSFSIAYVDIFGLETQKGQ